MALQLTYTSQAGLTATNAYHRVEGVSIDGKTKIKFHVRSYADVENYPSFEDQALSCSYDIAGNNPIQQAYEHLKTLPEFAGATDV